MVCGLCATDIPPEDAIQCSECKSIFHYNCMGMIKVNFKKMSKVAKENWKCVDCKGNTTLVNLTEDPINESGSRKLESLFEKLSKNIKAELADFKTSLDYNSGQLDSVLAGFNELKQSFSQMQKKQQELENENNILKKTIKELKYEVGDIEQKSLDHSLEINGIPKTLLRRARWFLSCVGSSVLRCHPSLHLP